MASASDIPDAKIFVGVVSGALLGTGWLRYKLRSIGTERTGLIFRLQRNAESTLGLSDRKAVSSNAIVHTALIRMSLRAGDRDSPPLGRMLSVQYINLGCIVNQVDSIVNALAHACLNTLVHPEWPPIDVWAAVRQVQVDGLLRFPPDPAGKERHTFPREAASEQH